MGQKPLAGIRVLELARILAGPWAGQLLADLGADVIKVERPGSGDDTRAWGPPFIKAANGGHIDSAYFHCCNRGKRSIELDMAVEQDRNAIIRLAKRSDVLIENFKTGGLAKYGLDHDSLKKANPKLVYCSITGFGQNGPYAGLASYDFMIQGMSGIMDLTGEPDGEPQKIGVAFADIFTALYSVIAIQAALVLRTGEGKGCHIDMSLLDCMSGVLANQALNHFAGDTPRRMGNVHPNISPYQVFPSADGPVIIAVGNDQQFAALCGLLGTDSLVNSPDYSTNEMRVRNRLQLSDKLGTATIQWKRNKLLESLEKCNIAAAPINSVAEAFGDPQMVHRGMKAMLQNPEAIDGLVPTLRTPIMVDGGIWMDNRPAPKLGEHTQEIFDELSEDS